MEARNRDLLRIFLALLMPVFTFALQWTFWSDIQPYAWLLFLPAVFVSSWIGGLIAGLISTFLSATLVTWFFIPPPLTLVGKSPIALVSIVLFCIMGILFSVFHWRLKSAGKLAEEAAARLRESEENLSVTLNSIGDAVIATDEEGQITRLNAVAEQLTGWANGGASGKPIGEVFKIINQKTRNPASLPVTAVLEQGIIHGLANDTLLIARDGKETPIADSCAPIRDRNGRTIGTVLVFRDVSKEHAAQAALQESSMRIETILNAVVDGIININEQGVIEMMNPAAERIFGYPAGEVVGRNVSMLMPEPHCRLHDTYIDRYRATGKSRIMGAVIEVEGLRKNGGVFPLELAVNEMRLGDVLHFIGVTRDITARKEAENHFNKFFSISLDMLCISSADGYFKRVNPAFTKTLGWSVEEFTSRPYLDFIHPDDHGPTLRAVAKQVDAGEDILKFENRFRRKDGTWRILSWMSVPDNKGLMYATARDVTEYRDMTQNLIAAKEQAELADRAKGSFLATMSHEIRTPLTGMLGMLELLSLTSLDGEQRETLNAAWDSGRGLLRIVSDILDWSKIEEGKLGLAPRSTSIKQLLKDVVNAYSRVASAKSLMLWQHSDSRLQPAYIVDSLRLSQVLNNFVSNAIKFTQAGEIEVRAELIEHLDSGDRICFSVKDTGAGIAREVQDRLFRRYSQESADTARMYGGTGLGLSICSRLADLMDGQIKLKSAPGQGSVFSIILTLPISGLPAETLENVYPDARHRDILPILAESENSPLVLAVDDHPVNRDLLARQIRLLGLRADSAENGKAALAMWRNGDYSLVVTDCHMPEMDGYALVGEIRKIEEAESLAHTPVIGWTANALAEESDRCLNAGMDDLLIKPADMIQLRNTLAKWLGIPIPENTKVPQEPIDREVLDAIVKDKAAQMQVLRDFLEHIRTDHERLPGLMESRDLVGIAATAHRMKGSSRMVGAKYLAEACEVLEKAARNGDLREAEAARAGLLEAVTRIGTFTSDRIKG
ncbi:MAG: PAS domain S-box protein [Gammaproteobacteria bacterium]|nr:PAS domain S-box protein [Gammaproteobacteria bacterium]